MATCVRRLVVAAVISGWGVGAAPAIAGPIHLIGVVSESVGPPIVPAFDVFASLTNPLSQGPPIRPDLSDPTMPRLNIDNIQNHVLFEFGLSEPGGPPVTFETLVPVPTELPRLLLDTRAQFGGNFFDVQFTAFFTNTQTNSEFKPDHYNPVTGTGPPIFPAGSLGLDFAAMTDPPFTIDITVRDLNGDLATFTDAPVPEPGSLTLLCGFALTLLGGWRMLRRKPAA